MTTKEEAAQLKYNEVVATRSYSSFVGISVTYLLQGGVASSVRCTVVAVAAKLAPHDSSVLEK